MIKIAIPTTMNDACNPNIAEIIPNESTPTISHNFPTNSSTPDIVPSSSGLVQSEIYPEITGRISDNHNEMPNVIVMIFRNHSLYPSNI